MGLLGMIASGCGFAFIGLWQAWIALRGRSSAQSSLYSSRSPIPDVGHNRQSPFFSSAQLISISALSFLHIVSGLVASHEGVALADGIATAVPLERSGVALVFFIFSVSNLLCMHTSFLPLPREVSHLIGLVAFAQELLLFHLRRPDAGLEGRYYTLLQVPITASIIALIAMIASPMSVLPPLSLAASLFLQGTWLIQMGLSFFTSIYMPKGCALQMRGEGDYVIKCLGNDMALMHGNAVATLQFNCHMALLLILLLPMYSVMRRRCGPPNVYDLNYEMVSVVEPRIGEKHSSSPVEPPASAFSLESEEYVDDENLKPEQQHQDANGLHRVIN